MQKAKHHFGRLNASNGEHGRMSPRMVSHGLNVSLHPKPPRTQHLPRGGCIIFIFDSTAQHELFLLSFFFFQKKCFEGLRGSTIRLFRVPEIQALDVLRPLKTHISRHLIQSLDSGSKKKSWDAVHPAGCFGFFFFHHRKR